MPAPPSDALTNAGFTRLWSPTDPQAFDRLWQGWRPHVGVSGPWPGEDVSRALLHQFCNGLWVEDPNMLAALDGPVLFLANHQVAIESLTFAMALTPFLPKPLHAISKAEHAGTWVGGLFSQLYRWPGVTPLDTIFFYRQGDAAAMLTLMTDLEAALTQRRCGLLVHVAGSRVLSSRDTLRTMSSVFIDLAIKLKAPIVPVKFAGGLPESPLEGFLDFPVGYGRQDYVLGRPIDAATLTALPLPARRNLVLERINALPPKPDAESPNPPDRTFQPDLRHLMTRFDVLDPSLAAIWAALTHLPTPPETPVLRQVLEGIDTGSVTLPDTPEGRWGVAFTKWLTETRVPARIQR